MAQMSDRRRCRVRKCFNRSNDVDDVDDKVDDEVDDKVDEVESSNENAPGVLGAIESVPFLFFLW